METTTKKTLQELGPGDPVVIVQPCGWSPSLYTRATVERVTKTLLYVQGQRYRRKNGETPGEWGSGQRYLEVPTPQLEEEMREAAAKRRRTASIVRLTHLDRRTVEVLTQDQRDRIAAILDEPRPEPTP